MKIKRFVGGNLESNGYVIYQKPGGDCYIVDPGYNPEKFIKYIKEEKLKLLGILLTHHHYDHMGGVEKIRELTECPVYIHKDDADLYQGPWDVLLYGGEIILLEEEKLEVLHTPGHTEGGVCYYSEKSKLAFTGDTIFNVDLGRTDLKDGADYKMEASIREVINKWSNEITIYPGHGDSCNMKFVRRFNKEFLDIV